MNPHHDCQTGRVLLLYGDLRRLALLGPDFRRGAIKINAGLIDVQNIVRIAVAVFCCEIALTLELNGLARLRIRRIKKNKLSASCLERIVARYALSVSN